MLFSTVAAGFAASAPSLAFAQGPAPANGEVAKMNALFDDAMAKLMRQAPELTTSLGLDKGDLAWTKGLLSDRSFEAIAAGAAQTREQLKALRAIDRKSMSGMDAVNYDTVEFTLAVQDEGNKFPYAGGGSGAPYVLSQLTGSYQQMPDFLDTQHAIETKADADAYLQRMEGFARLMDQETLIAKRDYADGVIPPDFVIDKALIQMKSFADTPTAEAPLIKSIVRRTKEKKIEGDWAGEATKVYLNSVLPALKRQIALLESVRPKATHDAGVWRLKNGGDYYATSLKNYTTSTLTPDEIHQLGLDMVKSIEAQADKIFKSMGMKTGTVGQRMAELGKDIYENTDAAKEQLIADLNVKAKWIDKQLPAYFGELPKAPLEIRRVPKAIEAGAPGGYYNSPSLDGKRPGIYWINLRDTAEQPKYLLTTLTVHEGVPGHHLQLCAGFGVTLGIEQGTCVRHADFRQGFGVAVQVFLNQAFGARQLGAHQFKCQQGRPVGDRVQRLRAFSGLQRARQLPGCQSHASNGSPGGSAGGGCAEFVGQRLFEHASGQILVAGPDEKPGQGGDGQQTLGERRQFHFGFQRLHCLADAVQRNQDLQHIAVCFPGSRLGLGPSPCGLQCRVAGA